MATQAIQKNEDLSKGAQWIIDRIDSMQDDYREALIAAVTILQYQNQSRRLRTGRKDVPRYMSKKLDDAWSRYEATRRHVEWYMKQNALYASSPSHPAIIMPTPQPANPDPSLLAPTPQDQPKASPVPLSTASLLAYDNNSTSQLSASTVPTSAPMSAHDMSTQQALDPMGFNTNPIDLTGETNMNFSSLGINELQNLINSTTNFYPSQSADSGQAAPGTTADFTMFNNGDKGLMGEMTPNTQAETDKILASLRGGNAQIQQTANSQNNGDMAALLASMNGTSSQNGGASDQATNNPAPAGGSDQTNFDFNFGNGGGDDVDFSALVGLFSDNTTTSGLAQSQAPATPTAQAGQQQYQQSPAQHSPTTQPSQPQQDQRQGEQQSTTSGSQASQAQTQSQQGQQLLPSSQHTGPSLPAQPAASPQQKLQPSQPSQQTQQNPFGSNFNMADLAGSSLDLAGLANPSNGNGAAAPGDPGEEGAYGGEQINLDEFNFEDDGMPNVDDGLFESMFAEFK